MPRHRNYEAEEGGHQGRQKHEVDQARKRKINAQEKKLELEMRTAMMNNA